MKRFVVPLVLGLVVVAEGALVLVHETRATSLHVLDVGQGDAILVRRGSVDVLVDGGPDASVLERLGEVRPPWDRTIEVVVVTHPQVDHFRGLLDVVDRENVRLLLVPEIPATSQIFRAFVERIRARGIPVRAARAGQILRIGDLTLRVLAPNETLLARARANPNLGAVVLRGDVPGFSFLLTGDIEASTETALLRSSGEALDVDVLKVAHHGSKTSSTPAFLRAVSPGLAVISVGQKNRYGHPHDAVVRRFTPERLLRTDLYGTVSLTARRGQVVLRCARTCRPR